MTVVQFPLSNWASCEVRDLDHMRMPEWFGSAFLSWCELRKRNGGEVCAVDLLGSKVLMGPQSILIDNQSGEPTVRGDKVDRELEALARAAIDSLPHSVPYFRAVSRKSAPDRSAVVCVVPLPAMEKTLLLVDWGQER
jgi:hypothetical protein